MQHGGDLRLPPFAHHHVHGRIFLLEAQQAFGDERGHQRAQRSDGDAPTLHPAQGLAPFLRRADDAAGKGQEGHALVGQRHHPAAHEQLRPQELFQRPYAHRSGGLGDVEIGRRLGEALLPHDAVEGAKLVEVHWFNLCQGAIHRRISLLASTIAMGKPFYASDIIGACMARRRNAVRVSSSIVLKAEKALVTMRKGALAARSGARMPATLRT